jgi:hypothetical protein
MRLIAAAKHANTDGGSAECSASSANDRGHANQVERMAWCDEHMDRD